MSRAIEKLVWNHKLKRFVFFLERANGRDRQNPFNPKLFEAVDIGSEIQFGRK
jgi:hypothetical protein